MARTVKTVRLRPEREDARPKPLLKNYAAIEHKDSRCYSVDEPTIFRLDCKQRLDLIETGPGSGCLVAVPYKWKEALDYDSDMEQNGDWRDIEYVRNCWKLTDVFEQLSSAVSTEDEPAALHRNLLAYRGSDPWTRFPLFVKPPNAMPLIDFLRDMRATLYVASSPGQTRVHPGFRTVMYQWVLHIISALSLLHANGIMIGEIDTGSLLLASDSKITPSPTQTVTAPRIYLADLQEATYHSKSHGGQFIQGIGGPCIDFITPLRHIQDPTPATDIFLVGVLIHELITGSWPEGYTVWSGPKVVLDMPGGPRLEKEFLGDITRKCWDAEYENIEVLQTDLVQYLNSEGWETDSDHNLRNLNLE